MKYKLTAGCWLPESVRYPGLPISPQEPGNGKVRPQSANLLQSFQQTMRKSCYRFHYPPDGHGTSRFPLPLYLHWNEVYPKLPFDRHQWHTSLFRQIHMSSERFWGKHCLCAFHLRLSDSEQSELFDRQIPKDRTLGECFPSYFLRNTGKGSSKFCRLYRKSEYGRKLPHNNNCWKHPSRTILLRWHYWEWKLSDIFSLRYHHTDHMKNTDTWNHPEYWWKCSIPPGSIYPDCSQNLRSEPAPLVM